MPTIQYQTFPNNYIKGRLDIKTLEAVAHNKASEFLLRNGYLQIVSDKEQNI